MSNILIHVSPELLIEISEKRRRQDAEWGGPAHDDTHGPDDWCDFIEKQVERCRDAEETDEPARVRERLIKIAALAIAAVESFDRKRRA